MLSFEHSLHSTLLFLLIPHSSSNLFIGRFILLHTMQRILKILTVSLSISSHCPGNDPDNSQNQTACNCNAEISFPRGQRVRRRLLQLLLRFACSVFRFLNIDDYLIYERLLPIYQHLHVLKHNCEVLHVMV